MTTTNPELLTHHHQLMDAIARDENMARPIKSLLIGIASFFNLTNQCAFPSREQISKRTGYCPNHITALIKLCVFLGYIRSTPQFVQVEGESAPRQIANKYEFVLEKFGLFYNKAKSMLNRNLRKKDRKAEAAKKEAKERAEHIDRILKEATFENQDDSTLRSEDYSPPG